MAKSEFGGVERQPAKFVALAAVYWIAHNRMSEFGQMDPDLMRAAGFEPAGHERMPAERLNDLDVRHRQFTAALNFRAAPPAIAAIAHEPGADGLRVRLARYDRLIPSFDRVRM